MALRCLLVGLVASLGFELPSGQDVTSWTRLGRDWVASRTITLADIQASAWSWIGSVDPAASPELATAAPALADAVAPAAPAAPIVDDLAFAAIGEAMATSFAADFEMALREAPAEPALAPPAEEVVAAEPETEAQPEHDSMALAHAEAAGVVAESTGAVVEPDASPSVRLNSAVRATREAMNAWSSLVQAVGREVVTR